MEWSMSVSSPLAMVTIACAAIAAAILIWYLIRRPQLGPVTKIALLLGLGVFPIAAAGTGNVAGYEASKQRSFCGSCHVMVPWAEDSDDPSSTSLAARHARNPFFGDENCYACHADYGMYGTVTTKIGGLRHVYEYTIGGWHKLSTEEAVTAIHLQRPYPSTNCMQCHSTSAPLWREQSDHAGMLDELARGEVGCTGDGCHGPAHPFSKVGRDD
jgi:nitrate/TMAO reductase-like tetraheme cytochrome c subunit